MNETGAFAVDDILNRIKGLYNAENVAGMTRFGINPNKTFGVPIPTLRKMAKEVGKQHDLARELWKSGIHEARILAVLVEDPAQVGEKQMEAWVVDFDSWDVCDQCCSNLFDLTPFAHRKAKESSEREEEFVKRAGFVLMATLAVHDKRSADEVFLAFLPIIARGATDDRNFVKKAVNWALRQIGKRNMILNEASIRTAIEIRLIGSRSATWIAGDALRELTDEKVRGRIG